MKKISRQHVYVSLIFLALLSFLVSFAVNSICIFLLLLFFLVDKKENIKAKLKYAFQIPFIKWYVGLVGVQFLGLFHSQDIQFGLNKVIVPMFPIVFLPVIIVSEKISKSSLARVLGLISYLVLLIFAVLILKQRMYSDMDRFVNDVIVDKLGLSQFYVLFILLIPLLNFIDKIKSKNLILLHVSLLIFTSYLVLILSNKTSLGILFIILFLKGMSYVKSKKLALKFLSFAIVLVLGLFYTVEKIPKLNSKIEVLTKTTDLDIETIITKNSITSTKNTFEHRLLINYLSLQLLKDHPVFGLGTGDYQSELYKKYEAVNFKLGKELNLNNHNQYMSEFMKNGIIGGIIFIGLMLFLIKSGSISNRYFLFMVVAFAFACLFESYLNRQHGVIIFAFIIPLCFKIDQLLFQDTDARNIETQSN